MKSYRKIAWRIALVVLIAALAGLIWYWSVSSLFREMSDTTYRYKEVSTSPDGLRTVTVWRSNAVWSFGPAAAKVVAVSGDEEQEYETQIFDDGGRGEVDICWQSNVAAQVTLRGQEQQDELVAVDFSKGIDLTADRPTREGG